MRITDRRRRLSSPCVAIGQRRQGHRVQWAGTSAQGLSVSWHSHRFTHRDFALLRLQLMLPHENPQHVTQDQWR